MAEVLNQKKARALLEANGWTCERGGKHAIKMTKVGDRPVTLPHHGGRDYSAGLAAAIRRQAGV